jgi:CRP/FNR family transcriptional regulator, cyclic AMP receptor protein
MYLHPLTANLPAAEREALIKCSELRHYKRNARALPETRRLSATVGSG